MTRVALLLLLAAALASCTRSGAQPSAGAEPSPYRLSRMEESGRRVYVSLCAYCHGASGDGFGLNASNLPVPPRDHTDSAYMNRLTDEQLFAVIKFGGASQGKSVFMPPWAGRISDRDIAALVAYVRALGRQKK